MRTMDQEDIINKEDSCSADFKTSPWDILKSVTGQLKKHGLEVVIDDGGGDGVTWLIEKIKKDKPQKTIPMKRTQKLNRSKKVNFVRL